MKYNTNSHLKENIDLYSWFKLLAHMNKAYSIFPSKEFMVPNKKEGKMKIQRLLALGKMKNVQKA